ncbi:hypothetical protein K8R04_04295 [Candidatus Uhrbacteria bacterium]|nr:hypothetical protein [Candidatus Uhrbacteria bacterium]
MISVFRTSQQEIDAFLASRIKRCPTRSGGLICYAQIEPISAGRIGNGRRMKRTHAAKRRTFRDLN